VGLPLSGSAESRIPHHGAVADLGYQNDKDRLVHTFTTWIFLSWLVCYPGLRQRYRSLYSRNGERFETYKHRALAMHHQDISDNHVKHRWTTKGVVVNPWEYTTGTTQSTDGILNPVLVFCEHL